MSVFVVLSCFEVLGMDEELLKVFLEILKKEISFLKTQCFTSSEEEMLFLGRQIEELEKVVLNFIQKTQANLSVIDVNSRNYQLS